MPIDRHTGIITQKIDVAQRSDRVTFDLVVPRDAKRITGIHASASASAGAIAAFGAGLAPVDQAGLLSLRWFAPGDIFYQAKVDMEYNFESSYTPAGMGITIPLFSETGFHVHGTRHEPVAIEIDGRMRRIRGFYKDTVNLQASTDDPYFVFVNLYYEKAR